MFSRAGEWGKEFTASVHEGILWGGVTVPYLDCGGSYTTVTQHCAVKGMKFTIYKLCLDKPDL